MKRQTCNHDRFAEIVAEHEERQRRFEHGVERLLWSHHPYPDTEDLRPGNSGRAVRFWCERCRSPWPCKTFNDLRALYGEVVGYAPALRPYEPLVLTLADPDDEATA